MRYAAMILVLLFFPVCRNAQRPPAQSQSCIAALKIYRTKDYAGAKTRVQALPITEVALEKQQMVLCATQDSMLADSYINVADILEDEELRRDDDFISRHSLFPQFFKEDAAGSR